MRGLRLPPVSGHFAYRELPGKAVFERVGFNASQLSAAWSLPGQALFRRPSAALPPPHLILQLSTPANSGRSLVPRGGVC